MALFAGSNASGAPLRSAPGLQKRTLSIHSIQLAIRGTSSARNHRAADARAIYKEAGRLTISTGYLTRNASQRGIAGEAREAGIGYLFTVGGSCRKSLFKSHSLHPKLLLLGGLWHHR